MCKIAVAVTLPKREEVVKLKGKTIRKVLGLDYTKVSEKVSETWTDERREQIKKVARQVGVALAETWEVDPDLAHIAGTLSKELFDKVKMPSTYRKALKATRFKYHEPGSARIWIIAFPAKGRLEFAHALKTGAVEYGMKGYLAEYEKTERGLQLIKVHVRTFDPRKLFEVVQSVKPELLDKARNKLGMHLRKAFEQFGIKTS